MVKLAMNVSLLEHDRRNEEILEEARVEPPDGHDKDGMGRAREKKKRNIKHESRYRT